MTDQQEPAAQQRAQFTDIKSSTKQDWALIAKGVLENNTRLPDRLIGYLRALATSGADFFPIDRLQHSLQTATLAYRANRDDQYILCCLLHDVGDLLAPYNHADVAAAILKPFVTEQNHWLVANHGVFQGYYYWGFLEEYGLRADAREVHRGSPWFDYACEFVEEFDQRAFDPNYATLPLEHFEPLIRELTKAPLGGGVVA